MNQLIRKGLRAAIAVAMLAAFAVPMTAVADTLNENTVAVTPVVVGNTVSAAYWLMPTGVKNGTSTDPVDGCNATGNTPVTVTVSASPAGLTVANPGTVSLTGCGDTTAQSIVLTPTAAGTYTITGTAAGGKVTGTFVNSTFNLTVTPPPAGCPPNCVLSDHPDISIGFGTADGLVGWYVHNPVSGTITATAKGGRTISSITCTTLLGTVTQTGTSLSASAEGDNAISCTATDSANLSSSATNGVSIDSVAPADAPSASGTAGNSPWYRSPVTVTWNWSDATSGPNHCDASSTTSGQGSVSLSSTCSDFAGKSSTDSSQTFSVDTVAPVISGAASPSVASTGWYNISTGAPTVTFTCTDATSGPGTPTAPSLLGEGAGQSKTGNCSDVAGNPSGDVTVGPISVDLTAPGISGAVSPAAASTGWYNISTGAPTVTFTCTDATSGPGTTTALSLLGEGAGQSKTGNCSDVAGNPSGDVTVGPISVDLTAPTVSVTGVSSPYVLNSAISTGCTVTETGSGPASGGAASNTGTGSVGAGHADCTAATDVAGNTGLAAGQAYSVIYSTTLGHAITSPINADGSSVVKLGSTVPAKFFVADVNGNHIGTPGVVSSFKLIKTLAGTVTAEVNEDVISTTPDTAFRYDATAQQWIYNISTKNLTSGTKYTYRIGLNDGSSIDFTFGVKK